MNDMATLVTTRQDARRLGVTRYFTGKPCPHGHISERFVSNSRCIGCADVARSLNRVAAAARTSAWRKENHERAKESCRNWHAINSEKANEKRRKHYLKNRDKALAAFSAWGRSNKDARKAIVQAYRARKASASGRYTSSDIQRIMNEQKKKCAYCRKGVVKSYHVDHIIPLSKGGTNQAKNVQITCARCNLRKRDTDPISFAQRLGRLL